MPICPLKFIWDSKKPSICPNIEVYAQKGLCLMTSCPKGICLLTGCLKGNFCHYDSWLDASEGLCLMTACPNGKCLLTECHNTGESKVQWNEFELSRHTGMSKLRKISSISYCVKTKLKSCKRGKMERTLNHFRRWRIQDIEKWQRCLKISNKI